MSWIELYAVMEWRRRRRRGRGEPRGATQRGEELVDVAVLAPRELSARHDDRRVRGDAAATPSRQRRTKLAAPRKSASVRVKFGWVPKSI